MGVPKFFRYISERYPCLGELARVNCIPELDNLYLDMNGIIHNCSHPDDSQIKFSLTEEQMFEDICSYIDKLFFLIKPQRLFFMAIDGVAPRAKMNQQRSRRFRTAKETEIFLAQAEMNGDAVEAPFDSNCITPGTEFMAKLHEYLRNFVKRKMSTDTLWQKCRVILSGHDSPGEGEHKIMDYIRYLKSQKDYDPYTRHCLYGLDADLIILGLCTHESHFVILREEVKFGRKAKKPTVDQIRFFFLHLGLFREYIELEFAALKQYESFNLTNLIDDWVLLGFLVGNDFVPGLPFLHINNNALPMLYETYIKVYPKLGGNINEGGTLNIERLYILMEALSELEQKLFQDTNMNLKYLESKESKNNLDETFGFEINEIFEQNQNEELAQLIKSSREFFEDLKINDNEDMDGEQQEFELYKRNYYVKKLNYEDPNEELLSNLAREYVTALQWILNYYYQGVQSWSWFYPEHYSPFICDFKNIRDIKVNFEMGKPFAPFQQLMAVLPASSRGLLPVAYQDLFINPNSEIVHFYPKDFETDLNGKRNDWEAIVLIPFVDEDLLIRAMKTCDSKLEPHEEKRNLHGPMIQYDFNAQSQGEYQNQHADKGNAGCTEKHIWRDEITSHCLERVLRNSKNRDEQVFLPGFPTMKHLTFDFVIKNARIKVFDYPAKCESVVLLPQSDPDIDVKKAAQKYLNQVVYIGWPHLVKAIVTGVASESVLITSDGEEENNRWAFLTQVRNLQDHLSSRMGIHVDNCAVLVHVKTLVGTSVSVNSQGKVVNCDVWSTAEIQYPAVLVVSEIAVHNQYSTVNKKLENLYPPNSRVFFVGSPYFGSEGTVLNPMLAYECGRLKVNIRVLPVPDLRGAKVVHRKNEEEYLNVHSVQAILGINVNCIMRLSAPLFILLRSKGTSTSSPKRLSIGLPMRSTKPPCQVYGYTYKTDNGWHFSQTAINLLKEYLTKFPEVLEYLARTSSTTRNEFIGESDAFGEKMGLEQINEIVDWIAEQDVAKAEIIPCGSKRATKEAIEEVIASVDKLKGMPVKTVTLQVKPHLLMKPGVNIPLQYQSKSPIRLFDRIVVVQNAYSVPLGSRGTVIGIIPESDPNPVRVECVKQKTKILEVILDKSMPDGDSIFGLGEGRCIKIYESCVLPIYSNESYTEYNDNKQSQVTNWRRPANQPLLKDSETAAPKRITNFSVLSDSNPQFVEGSLLPDDDFWAPVKSSKQKPSVPEVRDLSSLPKPSAQTWTSLKGTQQKHFTPSVVEKQTTLISNANRCWRPIKNQGSSTQFDNNHHESNPETEVLKSMLGLHNQKSSVTGNAPRKPMINAALFPSWFRTNLTKPAEATHLDVTAENNTKSDQSQGRPTLEPSNSDKKITTKNEPKNSSNPAGQSNTKEAKNEINLSNAERASRILNTLDAQEAKDQENTQKSEMRQPKVPKIAAKFDNI